MSGRLLVLLCMAISQKITVTESLDELSKLLGKCSVSSTQRPFSEEAFKSWNKFANPNFPERYCHFSGEFSKKQTSFSNPILTKNLKQF